MTVKEKNEHMAKIDLFIKKQKERQLDRARKKKGRLKDIVLVTIPTDNASKLYNKWRKKKATGGPDKLWPPEFQEKVFRGVLEGFFPQEKIEEMWQGLRENTRTLKH